jgi:hypothetical protein
MDKYNEVCITTIVHHKDKLRKNDRLSNQHRVQSTLNWRNAKRRNTDARLTPPVSSPCLTGESQDDSSIPVFRRCAADRRLKRCGAELLSALLPEGKMRKSPVFHYFPRSWAGHEESRDCQTEFAGCYARQHNPGRSAHEPD